MIGRISSACAVLALMGCGASSIPDSNPNARGVGFGGVDEFQAQREARDVQLEARISDEDRSAAAIGDQTLAVLNQTASPGETIETTPTNVAVTSLPQAAPLATDNPDISDEQDFAAVSARESIESDRDRLARQREAMEVVQPQAVPERPGGSGPNVVSYALATTHPVGQPMHNRSSRFNEERYRRACAQYASPDQAQADFLANGGPERDRRGLDPDGDGYACFWDPSPFRAARGG